LADINSPVPAVIFINKLTYFNKRKRSKKKILHHNHTSIQRTNTNLKGQTVAQIKNINGHTVVFSRDNLASGLYFVRLTEKNQTIAVDKLVITD